MDYINVDKWIVYEGAAYGSGTSEQKWIINPTNMQIALFKEKKDDYTTDNISEKIASDIANELNLGCARIDLAIRGGKQGIISYRINSDEERIEEGINYISKLYPQYDRYKLIDTKSQEKYSLQMILRSIEGLNLERDLFKIFIFDFLIGNSDRHHSNWATITRNGKLSICPIYDNASSLCAYTKDEQIIKSKNDTNWINAIVDSKSKSIVRINEKRVKHSDFVRYLYNNYYNETVEFVEIINKKLTYEVINDIMDMYISVLSDVKIDFLKKYLMEKRRLILSIYKL